MPIVADLPIPLVPSGEQLSTTFTVLLVHILAGLIGVVAGAAAALSRKQRGRHPRFGTIYYTAVAVVFLTATVMGLLRWNQDRHLVVLGTLSFAAATLGYAARKIRWPSWLGYHIAGMRLSYMMLLTAFYVDNGPRLPVWDHLPAITYWTLPSLIGIPLMVRALHRYVHLGRRPRVPG
jgi:hypothetical protein